MIIVVAVLMALLALVWHPTLTIASLLVLPVCCFLVGIALNAGELAARQRRAEAARRVDTAEPLVPTTVPEGYTATPPEPVPTMVEPEWSYADEGLPEGVVSLDKARADRAEPQADEAAV